MTDKRVLIISMFLLSACDRTGDTERKALDAAAKAAERTKNIEAAVIYKDDLRKCRESGNDAGSYEVYEVCARKADDRYYGKDGGQ